MHKGSGLGPYSVALEKALLARLEDQFRTEGMSIRSRLPYTHGDDRGDIDFLAFEERSNRLLIGMLKGYIFPDTVVDVMGANEALRSGIRQAERAREWLNSLPYGSWKDVLRMPLGSTKPEVRLTILGNGFVGSDLLDIPGDISMVDVRYLLLPRWKEQSVFDAIDAYENRLSQHETTARVELTINTLEVGDVKIDVPSWSVTVDPR